MATRIIECTSRSTGLPVFPPVLREQTPMTAGVSAQTAAFGSGTEVVVIDSDEAIYVTTLATATTSAIKLAAGDRIEFDAREGGKIAILAA